MRLLAGMSLADYGARSYTTRAKEEQRRTAAPAFVGRVRRWEKRWVKQGHLDVYSWVRTDNLAVVAIDEAGGKRSASAARATDGTEASIGGSDESDEEVRSKRSRVERESYASAAASAPA